MQIDVIVSILKKEVGETAVKLNEPMAGYTTFHIGGPCDILVEAADEQGVQAVVRICRDSGLPLYILGNGSNVLVRDGGIRGCVLRMDGSFSNIQRTGETTLYAQAGVRNNALAAQCAAWGLSGCEFLSGIPGTLGGAVFMNAGAYQSETANIVKKVRALDEKNRIVELSKEDMGFSYRESGAERMNLVILGAELELVPGIPEEIQARIEDLNARRAHSQPLEYASAGSMFKRPKGHYAAALIDQAGLKGFSVGDGQVSEKHAGFIINKGHASAAEIEELVRRVQGVVQNQFQVKLYPEVRFWGEEK